MLRQRAISSVGVVIVFITPALFGSPIFTIAIALIAYGALVEIYRAFQRINVRPSLWTGMLALVALFLVAGTDAPFVGLAGTLTAYTMFSLAQHLTKRETAGSLADWVFSLTGLMYVGLTMMHFVLMRKLQGAANSEWVVTLDRVIGDGGAALGLAWLLFVLCATWATDVSAYLGGRRWGRSKLIPHVSPGKTREGALAALVGGTIAGALAAYVVGVPVPIAIMILLSLAVAVATIIGDLLESLIKREIGIKNMGTVIPGHGGILDRVDSLLVTVPFTYYAALLLDWRGWP
ncbi:phosphatidate cytidylyltransferase [soil metagenome]